MISIGGYFSEFTIVELFRNNQKGLTLVEILAALLLLSWLAFSITAIFGPAATWIAKARLETTAVSFAASMLEELRAEPEKISPLDSAKTAGEMGLDCESPSAAMCGQIARMQPQPSLPGLYEVTATVEWYQAGQPQSLQMVTLIRKEPR
ncbi:MAG: prepilin-type N-terminal cleavage/methylation domain-containing protein [Syntrophomonadaceae bacterium]|nr:prepilin-type N-terminal cleavage/methylation domain-containing protein [Syntrophomonadaceae bacterium]